MSGEDLDPSNMPGIEESSENELKALRGSERQYRRLFEAAKDGILIINSATGQIDDVNPFLVNLLGYSREEFMGRKLWEVGPFKDIAASKTAFEELQSKEYIRYDDLPLQARDGKLVSVEFVSNVYSVNGGSVIQCNIRDITIRKTMVDELRRAKEEAEQSNEAKTRFIGMLSHELKTPMNPVMMLIHAWKTEKLLPASFLPDLAIMQRCVEIQTRLIDDLLDITAIIRGKLKLEFKPQDIHELLDYAKSLCVRTAALSAALRISVAFLYRGFALGRSLSKISLWPMMAVRMLLNSWAIPPANFPTVSIF